MKVSLPFSESSGQTVLVILLVMAVILTVGLSIASRSLTDLKMSQQTQESARAFWVAQAVLDKAIKANAGESVNYLDEIRYEVSKTSMGGGRSFVYPGKAEADNPLPLWLIDHNAQTGEILPGTSVTGTVTLYWGNAGTPANSAATPALEISLVYRPGADFMLRRWVFDPNSARRSVNNFSAALAGGLVQGQTFAFASSALDITSYANPYMVRLRLIYADSPHALGLASSFDLPNQGDCYDSRATVEESGISSRLSECVFWKTSPSIFDYLVFSGGSL